MVIEQKDYHVSQLVIDLHLIASIIEQKVGQHSAVALDVRKAADKLSDIAKQKVEV
jgi:hypothetical protein